MRGRRLSVGGRQWQDGHRRGIVFGLSHYENLDYYGALIIMNPNGCYAQTHPIDGGDVNVDRDAECLADPTDDAPYNTKSLLGVREKKKIISTRTSPERAR